MKQREIKGDIRVGKCCIFCHRYFLELTREHAPSKILINEPFPENLPIVYSCKECNSSFSLDEEYVACIIECARCKSTQIHDLERLKIRQILSKQKKLYDKIRINNGVIDINRMKHVVTKLSICHLFFETNTLVEDNPDYFNFFFRDNVSINEINNFNKVNEIYILPEISRCYDNILLMDDNSEKLFYNWVIVQEEQYRYLCEYTEEMYIVKIVISEYAYFEIRWKHNL